MIYYHGTTSLNAERIKKDGISPNNSKYVGKIYLTTNYGEASKYAKIASDGKPGKVLKIHSDKLNPEHVYSNNSGIIEYKGSIHPDHISEETNVGMIAGSGDFRLPVDQREPGININIKNNKKILRRKKLNLDEDYLNSLSLEELSTLAENIDQLDELSKETLLNYIQAANHSGHANRAMQKEDYNEINGALINTVINESPSDFYNLFSDIIYSKINDYVDSMKEDVAYDLFESNRLDELSRGLLARYVKKAQERGNAHLMASAQYRKGAYGKVDDYTKAVNAHYADYHFNKALKRGEGIKRAKVRIGSSVKEDSE